MAVVGVSYKILVILHEFFLCFGRCKQHENVMGREQVPSKWSSGKTVKKCGAVGFVLLF